MQAPCHHVKPKGNLNDGHDVAAGIRHLELGDVWLRLNTQSCMQRHSVYTDVQDQGEQAAAVMHGVHIRYCY